MSHDYKTMVNSWLTDLKSSLRLFDNLVLDNEGVCFVPHPSDLEVDVELPNGSTWLFIYAPVLKLDDHRREEMYAEALTLNLFQIQTNGGALGLDKAADEIMYCLRLDVSILDSHRFLQIFHQFIDTTHDLKAKIIGHGHSAAPVHGDHLAPTMNLGIPKGFSIKI